MGMARGWLFCFNKIILLFGMAAIGFGIWIVVDSDNFAKTVFDRLNEDNYNSFGASSVRIVGYLSIALGGAFFILAFVGCCGALKQDACLLRFFFILLVLIVIILIVFGILVFVYSDNIKG